MIDLRKLSADDDVISDLEVVLMQLIKKNWILYGIQIQPLVSIEGGLLLYDMNGFQDFSGKILRLSFKKKFVVNNKPHRHASMFVLIIQYSNAKQISILFLIQKCIFVH